MAVRELSRTAGMPCTVFARFCCFNNIHNVNPPLALHYYHALFCGLFYVLDSKVLLEKLSFIGEVAQCSV